MPVMHAYAVAAMVMLSLHAFAQETPKKPRKLPSDADAPPAVLTYQSAFERYRPSSELQEMPDKRWRAANDEMERLGGHMGHIKDEPAAAPAKQHMHH